MSGFGPAGSGGNPFEGIFGDLARILAGQSQGPLNWDVARQIVALVANEGQPETNVDPLERIKLEELVRIAELHVNQQTDLGLVVRHIETVGRTEWATRTLEEYRPLLERLAESLTPARDDSPDFGMDANDPMAPFANMEKWMSPVLHGMQAGGTVAHLARRSLGQYDLPIPRHSNDTILLVPANINAFSSDWSLPLDELSLYVAVEEVTRLAVMARPHVHERFTELITEYVSKFQPDETALQDRLGELDVSDPSQLPAALTDPNALLGALQTPEQQQTAAHLNALVAVFVGYVDHIVSHITAKTISSASAITEAVKRRRVEESDGNRMAEKLLGLELAQPTFDRGHAFVEGVVNHDDGGEDGLSRLWLSARELPTPAEVDAPGLWLARIDLPD